MISFDVGNMRAVSSAKIELSGITVLSGPNGCGKSTVSKLFYYILDTATRFNAILDQDYAPRNMRYMGKALDLVLNFVFQLEEVPDEDRRSLFPRSGSPRPQSWIADVRAFFERFHDAIERRPDKVRQFAKSVERVFGDGERELKWETQFDALDNLSAFFDRMQKTKSDQEFSRPLEVLNQRLLMAFEEPVDLSPMNFVCDIDGESLFNFESSRLNAPVGVKQVFYIDTPWVADWCDRQRMQRGTSDYRLGHREHLVKVLQNLRGADIVRSPDLIRNIVHGSAQPERTDSGVRLQFASDDLGKVFNLFHCATGVKAFSILQMLLNGGNLDSETILVLDEPESNLHPQWIVEYARIIVLLHKELKVRFLVSTHSPDMVAAIQAIAQKESANDDVRFYLGKASGSDDRRFFFEPQGFDISRIFDSFNKSLDGIAQYGADVPDLDAGGERAE